MDTGNELRTQLLDVKEEHAGYSEIEPVTLEAREFSYGVDTDEGYKQLLHSVNATFMPGELVALMGPSGAGKTTLMTALAGNTSGVIRGGGIYVNNEPLGAQQP